MEIKNYIGGKWVTHSHLQSIAVTNPANGEHLATIPLSTANEVTEAVAVAKAAQKKLRHLSAQGMDTKIRRGSIGRLYRMAEHRR
ncbi:Malonate-semialdehyde dehydrogenase [Lysinibacillus sphaericus]